MKRLSLSVVSSLALALLEAGATLQCVQQPRIATI
jgi:hypothetical protein